MFVLVLRFISLAYKKNKNNVDAVLFYFFFSPERQYGYFRMMLPVTSLKSVLW